MAQFKLSLIVPNNDELQQENGLINVPESFLLETITDYTSQAEQYKKTGLASAIPVSAYTYNEKISLHKHGQKELTFNMDDKILSHNEWIINPFASILKIGVQIELQDKYNNCFLFTIKNIQYSFNNLSIVYNITCQDSFTYQASRQNTGYVLANDETSVDFLGAYDLDYWAEKIAHDCYLSYTYIRLDQGLYRDKRGILHTYSIPSVPPLTLEEQSEILPTGAEVEKIIKPIYDKEHYADFYETFPFSASDSSANAALIAAAETIGLQLFVVEGHLNTTGPVKYGRYIFFAPVKNNEVSGLTYSPLQDIQDFNMSLKGDGFTTVLNVQSTTRDDEEIGLFPNIPDFFVKMFNNPTVWNSNVPYTTGMFTNLVKGYKYIYTINQSMSQQSWANYRYGFKLFDNTTLTWNNWYNRFKLAWSNKDITTFTINDHGYNAYQLNLVLAFVDTDDYSILEEGDIFHEFSAETFDAYNTNSDVECWLLLEIEDETPTVILNNLFINITRTYSEEEVAFAEVADNCPWLENKLIDFSYFERLGILSSAEYKNLINYICNDIRLINGQLMCYSTSYFKALKEQTEMTSKMTNFLDELNANFYASVVSPFANTGNLSANIESFNSTYRNFVQDLNNVQTKESLLGYDKLISDNINNFFWAEQRFLKNIYNFKEFFNQPNIYTTDSNTKYETVRYQMTNLLAPANNHYNYFSLAKTNTIFIAANTEGNSWISSEPLYRKEKGSYFLHPVVNKLNYSNFYVSDTPINPLQTLVTGMKYNDQNKYFLTKEQYQTLFETNVDDNRIQSFGGIDYVQLTSNELLTYQVYSSPSSYFIKNTSRMVPFDHVRCNMNLFEDKMTWFSYLLLLTNTGFADYDYFFNVGAAFNEKNQWHLYKTCLPVDTIYIKSPKINIASDGTVSVLNAEDQAYNTPQAYNQLYRTFLPIHMLNCVDNIKSLLYDNDKNSTTISTGELSTFFDTFNLNATTADYYACSKDCLNNKEITFTNGFPCYNDGDALISLTPNGYTDYNLLQYDPEITNTTTLTNPQKNNKAPTVFTDLHNRSMYKKGDSYWVNYANVSDFIPKVQRANVQWTSTGNIWKNYIPTCNYATFYQFIGATYSLYASAQSSTDNTHHIDEQWPAVTETPQTLWVKNKYAQFCKKTDIINSQDTYYWVITKRKNQTRLILSEFLYNSTTSYRFSALTFYPLINGHQQIDLTLAFDWDDLQTYNYTWNDYVTRAVESLVQNKYISDKYYYTVTWPNDFTAKISVKRVSNDSEVYSYEAAILRYEPFEKGVLIDGSTSYINSTNYRVSIKDWTSESYDDVLYLVSNYLPIQLQNLTLSGTLTLSGNTYTLYYLTPFVEEIRPATGLDYQIDVWQNGSAEPPVDISNQPIKTWYYKDTNTNEYIKTYTDVKLENDSDLLGKFYIIQRNNNTETCEIYDANIINHNELLVYQTQYDYDTTASNKVVLNKNIDPIIINFKYNINSSQDRYYNATGEEVLSDSTDKAFKITRIRLTQESLGSLTNGEFWFRFHDKSAISSLRELWKKTVEIETQLTVSWQQAYNASLSCQWFLPSKWQNLEGQQTNYFNQWIMKEIELENIYGSIEKHVVLLDTIVPEVKPVSYYDIKVDPFEIDTTKLPRYVFTYHTNIDNQHNMTDHLLSKDILANNNPAIKKALQYLFNENLNNIDIWDHITVVSQGNSAYYNHLSGGMLKADLVAKIQGQGAPYSQLNGLYAQQLYWLSHRYTAAPEHPYKTTLDLKLTKWRALYARFPGIFLENTYSNADVTSSTQLLKMAQYAFRDLSTPEKQYNISVIDAAALNGYQGQELNIGDAILLKTSDYYYQVDETYRALNQYLFISDISYELRKDDGVSLTVNPLKYQDKLIQALVKLIR